MCGLQFAFLDAEEQIQSCRNLESNMGSVCLAADALDVVISNAEISRTVGGEAGIASNLLSALFG